MPGTLGSMPRELPEDCRELLSLQHGVLSRAQALELGIGPRTVSSRLRRGHWQRMHQGVYITFTGQPDREALLWAALRRAGPDAVLSHWTAAELSRLTSQPSALIHVTVSAQRHIHPIPGVVIHRSRRANTARHPALAPPRTRIEETTLDLAAVSKDMDDALAWLARACGARLTTADRLRTALNDRTRMRWRAALMAGLDDISQGAHSSLELRYIRRVERPHGLPRPQRQVRIVRGPRTEYKDALYTEFGIGVETDGVIAHPLEARWRDKHRDNASIVDGIHTMRYNWADVTQRPCHVAAEVASALRQGGWRGTPHPCGPSCSLNDWPQH
jgi:predicted transcriptional regulator of viral defense system